MPVHVSGARLRASSVSSGSRLVTQFTALRQKKSRATGLSFCGQNHVQREPKHTRRSDHQRLRAARINAPKAQHRCEVGRGEAGRAPLRGGRGRCR